MLNKPEPGILYLKKGKQCKALTKIVIGLRCFAIRNNVYFIIINSGNRMLIMGDCVYGNIFSS